MMLKSNMAKNTNTFSSQGRGPSFNISNISSPSKSYLSKGDSNESFIGPFEVIKTEPDKEEILKEEETTFENKGIDQVQIVSHGLKLIFINDRNNNFLPVLSCNFSHFNVNMDYNERQSCIWTDLTSSCNFFNVKIGYWEPFIEKYNLKLMIKDELSEETNEQKKNF